MKPRTVSFAATLCAGLWLAATGCSQPSPAHSAHPRAPIVRTEATSLQAPFVLRLVGPAALPIAAGPLSLSAVLEAPSDAGDALPIGVEVIVPAGVTQTRGAAQQVVAVGGATPQATLLLSFQLAGPLTAPIIVRASLDRGEALHAVAERVYPEPTTPPPNPTDSSPAISPSRPLPGIPVGTPIETLH